MKKSKIFLTFLLISICALVSSIGMLIAHLFTVQPYLEKDNIVYHLNESGVVTSIEITITNPSLNPIENQELTLRYCREDSYPEGYSSPIVFSLSPSESKTIVITNFRNSWFYNKDYHIEVDGKTLEIENSNNTSIQEILSTIFFPLGLAGTIVFAIKLGQTRKKEKVVENN